MKSSFLKSVEVSDVFQLVGVLLVGVGIYLIFGLGWAFVASGIVLLLIGFFGQ